MGDVLNQLRRELTGRYEVEQELGLGGMAVVYLAKDMRHDRRVAIKVLRQDVGGASAERFLREIRTVAQLHHPHILQLLDSGTAGDHLFYVMPYVEGETIRQRLEREGPLPIDEAVRIAREVADALAFAHARGIVHRDIKPENVFLSAGHALVADFGIARAAESAAGGTTLTDAGLAVGTPSYMSPEQATADPKVDGRSDQYALGCVLYEMLAGAPPFTGPTSQAIMARHTADPVPPLRTVRDVPSALESTIIKALAKMPADRWPSTTVFAESLESSRLVRASSERATEGTLRRKHRWWAVGAAGVAAVAVLVWQVSADDVDSDRSAAAPVRSVAVAPFVIRGDTDYSLFADGLADGVFTGLVRVEGLDVKGGGLMLAFRERAEDPLGIGRELRVSAVVTAVVHVMGNRFRVTPQLLDVAKGTVLWGGAQFDGELQEDGHLQDLFPIQDSITLKIVEALRPQLTPSARAVAVRGVRTRDAEAYRLWLEARRVRESMTKDSLERAISLLEQAIARDSAYSDAWAMLAVTLENYSGWLTSPQQASASIERAVNRAIEMDSLNGFAYLQRGWDRALSQWDWDGAKRDLRRALALSPGSSDVVSDYAGLLWFMNEQDSSLVYTRRSFDSTSALSLMYLGSALSIRKPDSAIVLLEQALRIAPTLIPAHYDLAHLYLDAGRRAAADSAMNRFLEYGGADLAQGIGSAATYYRRADNENGAKRMLELITALSRNRQFGVHAALSSIQLALGDRSAALDALEASARARETVLPGTIILHLVPLTGDPRFEAVRREVFANRSLPPTRWP